MNQPAGHGPAAAQVDDLLLAYLSALETVTALPWLLVVRKNDERRWRRALSTRLWVGGGLVRYLIARHLGDTLDALISANRRQLAFRPDSEQQAQLERVQHFRASVLVPAHPRIVAFLLVALLFTVPVVLLGTDNAWIKAVAAAVTLDGVGFAKAISELTPSAIIYLAIFLTVPMYVIASPFLGAFRIKRILLAYGTRAGDLVSHGDIRELDPEDLLTGTYGLERDLLLQAGGHRAREVPVDLIAQAAILGAYFAGGLMFAIGARPIERLPTGDPVLSFLLKIPWELVAIFYAGVLGLLIAAAWERWMYRVRSEFNQTRMVARGLILGALIAAAALGVRSMIL